MKYYITIFMYFPISLLFDHSMPLEMNYGNQLLKRMYKLNEFQFFFFNFISTHGLFSIRIIYFSDIRIKGMHPCHVSYHNKIVTRVTFLILYFYIMVGNRPINL